MKIERVHAVVLATLLILTGIFVFQAYELKADPVPKTIFGQVNPNSTTGAIAYPGMVYFYIQNRTSEQLDTDIMYQSPPPPPLVEYYGSPIEDTIIDWEPGDPGIIVVKVEHGTYPGGDRVGYVAYSADILDNTGSQTFPTVELQKIPVPQLISNGTNWIEMSWTPLPDPQGLIAGYIVYRSDTNASDLDWGLVPGSGTVNAPITTNYFNDTSVNPGSNYYYAIKVVFNGIVDEPWDMTVDNHECLYFGEGSGVMETEAVPVGIDYIVIMDAPNNMGNPIWIDWPADTFTLYNVGETDTFYAAGFNYTLGYIKDIDVDWTVINVFGFPDTTNGTVTPGPSTSTFFEANSTHGGVLIVRADFSTATETTNFTSYIIVIPPQPDYIQIRDAMGNVVTTMTYGVAEVDQFYAVGFNNTAGYIGEVEVDWVCDFTSVGTVDPLGTMTNFTAQWVAVDSTCTVTATYGGMISNATGLLTVLYPRVDEIQIRTQDFGGGIELSDPANYPLYQKSYTTTFYGAQFNNTVGYIGSVSLTSTWTSNDTGIVDVTTPGNITTVTCDPVNTGWVWVNLTDGAHQASTIVTVSDITVDYILIRDQPFGGGNNLCDPVNYTSYPVGHLTTFYGAAYNYSVGYFKDVDVGSTWFSTDTSIVDAGSPGSSSPITCSNTNWGTVTITLTDFATGKQNTTQVTVLEPTVDTIMIRTDPGNGGSEVTTAIYIVLETDLFYAAAYNNTAGYLGEREVVWTIDIPSVGQVTSPGLWTNFTAQQVATDSTCTVTATYMGTIIDTTGLLTVLAPTVDSIIIRDQPGGAGNEVQTMTYGVADTDLFYAAAYNNTISYLYDVEVVWTIDFPSVGQVTTPGLWTNFTAQQVATDSTCTVTATYQGTIIDTTGLLTVLAPTVDSIIIRDQPGGAGNEVQTMIYSVADTDLFYAAAYNNTISYLYDVEVVWTIDFPSVGQVTTPGLWTNFTAQQVASDSTCTVTATYGTFSDSTGLLTVLAPRVDYIQIEDAAGGGGNIVDIATYEVIDTDEFYAVAYNDTINYLYEVNALWSSDFPSVGTVDPAGHMTNFTAQQVATDSTCTVTATYGTFSDSTGLLTVLYPRIDFIRIEDAAGGTGNIVDTAIYEVMDTDEFYAIAYNNTINYLYEVNALWSSDFPGVGTVDPAGHMTNFTAQQVATDSTCTITATYGTFSDTTGLLTVLYPRIDYIQIEDAAGGVGNIVDTASYNALETDMFYAAAYNNTINYLRDVEVAWQSDATGVGTVDPLGIWTNFTAQQILVTSTCTITATYMGILSDTTGLLTVNGTAPPVSSIKIMDEPGGVGNVVTTATYWVWGTDEFYCAAFDSGDTYLFDVEAIWSSNAPLVGQVDSPGHWTNFTAQWVMVDSTCTVTATYDSITNSTGLLTVLSPRIVELVIRDAPNEGGSIVGARTYWVYVNNDDTFYAAGYNKTVGYLNDVLADWVSDDETVGQVTSPGDPTTFTAQEVDVDDTCTVTASYQGISNTTGLLTVLYPRVDVITIRTAANDGGIPLGMEIFDVGNTSIYYAAGYNQSVYLRDITEAVWAITGDVIGTVTSPGASTTFTATAEGEGVITASYTYDSVTITDESLTIYVFTVDEKPSPPGKPTVKAKGSDKSEVTWPANTEPDVIGYIIYRTTDPDDPDSWVLVGATDNATTSFTDKKLKADTKYYYRITAVDQIGQESDPSEVGYATTEPKEEIPWVLLLLFIIIAIVVILLILFLWRKKKKEEEAMPPVGVPPEEAPVEEIPAEEYEEVPAEEYEEYEEAPAEEYEEYEEEPGVEYEEEIEYEEEEPETPTTPPPPPPPP